jgi:hypothetical protein
MAQLPSSFDWSQKPSISSWDAQARGAVVSSAEKCGRSSRPGPSPAPGRGPAHMAFTCPTCSHLSHRGGQQSLQSLIRAANRGLFFFFLSSTGDKSKREDQWASRPVPKSKQLDSPSRLGLW